MWPSQSLDFLTFQLYRDLENLKEKIVNPKIEMYQETWRRNRCQRLFHKELTQCMNIEISPNKPVICFHYICKDFLKDSFTAVIKECLCR